MRSRTGRGRNSPDLICIRRSSRNRGAPTVCSIRVTVHPSDTGGVGPAVGRDPVPRHDQRGRVVHEVEQVIEPAARIGRRPTVKLGLHLRYPPPRTHPILPGWVVVGRGVTIRWRVFRHYSLQSLLDTTAALRHVTGSPGLGLLRRLRPTPDRSADGVPSPQFHAGRVAPGRPGMVPVFTCRFARRRRHPTLPLRHRRGYPAARHHGLPSVPPTIRGVPRLRDEGDGCASLPAQIHQVRAGASLRGVERRFLAYCLSVTLAAPAPSGSTDTSRLCQGCSHPPRHLPGQAALSFTALLRQNRRSQVSHLHSNQQAPHGAPAERRTFLSASAGFGGKRHPGWASAGQGLGL